MHATDPAGAPVISIETLSVRALPAGSGQLAAPASLRDSVFELGWSPVADAGTAPALTGLGGGYRPPIACRPACRAARSTPSWPP